jgi:hypothetical protein
MKKLLSFILMTLIVVYCAAQTGIGWDQIRKKQNYKDAVNFASTVMIGGVTITATASQINILHSLTVSATELNYVSNVTGPIQAQITAKAPINSPVFTGIAKIGNDTIATRAYSRSVRVPEEGSAGVAWGDITETLSNQTDLQDELDKKANLLSPAFTGTVTGITAGMVGAISTSHASNSISASNISNWNSAYGWGNHAAAGYATTSALSGYVPATRTVNGHALSGNVTVTTTDLSLNNVNNTSDANKPISTATQTALNLKANISNPTFTTGITTPAITIGSTAVTSTATELNVLHSPGPDGNHLVSNGTIYVSESPPDTLSLYDYSLPKEPLENAQEDDYTLVLTDATKWVSMSSTDPITLTIPLNSSVAFPLRTQINIVSINTGTVFIEGISGVNIRSLDGMTIMKGQYAVVHLLKLNTNSWLLWGDLILPD